MYRVSNLYNFEFFAVWYILGGPVTGKTTHVIAILKAGP